MIQKNSNKEKKSSVKDKAGTSKIHSIKKELAEKIKEVDEHKELCQRIKAEFDNYRKRMLNDYDEKIKTASEDLIKRLLPAIDSFDRALIVDDLEKDQKLKAFYEGMTLINKQFKGILKDFDLIEINPKKNELFDPNVHEAVMVKEVEKVKDEVVVEVLEKGYMLSTKLLRAAKVMVGRPKS